MASGKDAPIEQDTLTRTALGTLIEQLSAHTSPMHVCVADVTGRVHGMSPIRGAEADGGDVPSSLPGSVTLRELWERESPMRPGTSQRVAFVETPAMQAISGRTVARAPFVVTRSGAHAEVEISAAPLRDAAGAVIGVVVTEQAVPRPVAQPLTGNSSSAVEMELADRLAAHLVLEEARSRDRRLAAVGQLAAGVMHDVNNALNPIMAAAYLLRHHAESPEAVRDYAERIRMAAETGAATASRVGRFIRQEPVHAGGDEMIDLTDIANEVIDLTEPMRLRRSSGSNAVALHRELDAGVLSRGLPGEIREALLNLVQNAIDAMPDGGTLTVRTFVEETEACIAIQDSGVGMSAHTVEHAFEPFFTTKGSGGSGLGLAEVYGIARRHRGTATIESEPGAGTAVTMRLPLERPSPAPPAVEAPVRSEPCRVLVVEDHDDGREFLRRLLRTEGHDVDVASSCAEAHERLAAAGSVPYHLMLTDVGLPDGSGWDLAAYARDHLPQLRVGVITGWEPMVSSAEARGAEFVLRKPLRAGELLAHIAGRKAPATPE